MPAVVSSTELTAAIAAATSALDGAKDAAYIDSLIGAIGSGYRRVLRRNGTTVWQGTASGSLSRTGTQMNVAAVTANASANADIGSGTWTHRIENAGNAAIFIESAVGASGSGLPGILSASLVSGSSATASAGTMNGPGFDTATVPVDTMISHMGPNTVILPGARDLDVMKGGVIIMGADWRSVSVPSWYDGLNFSGTRTFWEYAQPWYVVWDAQGHQANLNVRLAVRNLRTYALYDTAPTTWVLVTDSAQPAGDPFSRDIITVGGDASARPEGDGSLSIKIDPAGSVYHGYPIGATITPATLIGLHVRMQARKILENGGGPDQRSSARYTVQVGLDCYPFAGANTSVLQSSYAPGALASRFVEIGNDWMWVYGTTVIPARRVDDSVSRNSRHFMTEAAFRAAPPPV